MSKGKKKSTIYVVMRKIVDIPVIQETSRYPLVKQETRPTSVSIHMVEVFSFYLNKKWEAAIVL